MAHFKVGEKVLTTATGKVETVEEILSKVKAGKALTTWQKATVTKIQYPQSTRGKCYYTVRLSNGKFIRVFARNLKKIEGK